MLSVFPELFVYGLLAPVIIRLSLAVILFSASGVGKIARAVGLVIGVLLGLGLYTQVAALAAVAWVLINQQRFGNWQLRVLFIAAALSLLLSGAGLPAIDWPL